MPLSGVFLSPVVEFKGKDVILLQEYLSDLISAAFTLIAAGIGAYITMQTFQGSKKINASNLQLEKVYGPLFQLIEPHLYQKLTREQCENLVRKIQQIVSEGSFLSDPALKGLIETFERSKNCSKEEYEEFQYSSSRFTNTPNHYLEYWFEICNHIDQTYDRLCIICAYPLRSRGYRLEHQQYCNSFRTTLALLRFYGLPLLIFFITMLAMLLAIGYIS